MNIWQDEIGVIILAKRGWITGEEMLDTRGSETSVSGEERLDTCESETSVS